MWAFIFLCVLELNVFQAAGADNSTQMYYFKLTIDQNGIQFINKTLSNFTSSNTDLNVSNLRKTTTCKKVLGRTECRCHPGHEWSDAMCRSASQCCDSHPCKFSATSGHMCISNNIVVLNGSITIQDTQYQPCLADKMSLKYKACDDKLTVKMKEAFSTIQGFDVLKITKYSLGSVIADFILTINDGLRQEDLVKKSMALAKNLTAVFQMESTGIVTLTMPGNPVAYNSRQELLCLTTEDLQMEPQWQLRTAKGKLSNITTGTQASVSSMTQTSHLSLTNISEIWEGEYSCVFKKSIGDSGTIIHQASAVMDVALLPNIYITTLPAFPRCLKAGDLLSVQGKCEIRHSDENYLVNWTTPNKEQALNPVGTENTTLETVYATNTIVHCESMATLTCIFQNRLNQSRTATVEINIIQVNEPHCKAEGVWGDTKAGYTAEIKCQNSEGRYWRKCNASAKWEDEISGCVNLDVANLLQAAKDVDIGLGITDENAAGVFHWFRDVTNASQAINSAANMDASVEVLQTLSHKPKFNLNDTAVNDFLGSSSNLMEKSLEESWKERNAKDNETLGERYLSSMETLIETANVKSSVKNRNIEVAVCKKSKGSRCNNAAFNVTVDFDSSSDDNVTTTGFKQLQNYLPYHDKEYQINSIIVSTISQKRHNTAVKVNIKFGLLKPRPSNVAMKCVYWDNLNRQWSSTGCHWNGPAEYGECVCRHLSSFAILMAVNPIPLPGMTLTTIIGLSVSIVCLIITIIIIAVTWGAVVRTSTLYLRQTALINISVCLLVGDCCFLASHKPKEISVIWCKVFVVLKHFCFLSMFFWMLCLSCMLLHQSIFLFHPVSKKSYLKLSVLLGYVCPLCIVAGTVLSNDGGAEGLYFTKETCWLVFSGNFKGSIHTFIIPVGIVVSINIFSMVLVIMKFLTHPDLPETCHNKAKSAAKSVIRTVIFLTPVFGITWIFGFGVMLFDLSYGSLAYVCNYTFIVLNAFQGFFIFLTSCLGDIQIRGALLKRFRRNAPAALSESSTSTEVKKK